MEKDKKENIFNKVAKKGKVERESLKEDKTFQEKRQERFEDKALNLSEQNEIKKQSDYKEVQSEVGTSTTSNYVYLAIAPVIGFTVGPAFLLFNIGLDEEQLKLIKILLWGNAVGLLLTFILVVFAFKDGIKKTIMSVYRHFFTQHEVSDIKYDQIVKENKELKALISSKEEDKKELDEFRLQKRVQEEIQKKEKT